jgi:hypothetical protein
MQRSSLFLIFILFLGCSSKKNKTTISFYYWKSNFRLSITEEKTLSVLNCKTIYLRYFDVEFDEENKSARPISRVNFESAATNLEIIPVIYLKNEVFQKTEFQQLEKLVENITTLFTQINSYLKSEPDEVQFDCDWTETTKEKYFEFLKLFREKNNKTLSATIRLHQVKYKVLTGIPPVNKGVLMYYNMGEINSGGRNSIYEKKIADKYINFLKEYPLPLEPILPLFAWGIQSSDGKVKQLLNKMNESNFNADTNFTYKKFNSFLTKHSCFKSGYYFSEGDEIKIESVKPEELVQIADDLNNNLSAKPHQLLLYDLDSLNLNRYEKTLFQKILDQFN